MMVLWIVYDGDGAGGFAIARTRGPIKGTRVVFEATANVEQLQQIHDYKVTATTKTGDTVRLFTGSRVEVRPGDLRVGEKLAIDLAEDHVKWMRLMGVT